MPSVLGGDADAGALLNDEETKLVPVDKVFKQACIFKIGDDCRQDALALQVIQFCKDCFDSAGVGLFVYPYKILANRTGAEGLIGGVIECVPHAQTRDEIGKATACSLKDYFILNFGREDGSAFQQAQRNFILSLAGYSITSYLLQVKDRHNGNIMIDKHGHLIHIDFGFIFDISPANDLKFENAGFKLTVEMVEIMGNKDSPLWNWFRYLVVRGFLAVRRRMDDLIGLVKPMTASSLRCFKPKSLENLHARFFPDLDEKGAVDAMLGVIDDAYNKYTTNIYDYIQHVQQGIFYWRGAQNDEDRVQT